jgi:ankyrin repeat protein
MRFLCWPSKLAQAGKVEVIRALVDAGAEVELRAKNGRTPLHAAAENGQVDSITRLIDIGAHVETSDGKGWSALTYAVVKGNLECVQVLVNEFGASILSIYVVRGVDKEEEIQIVSEGSSDEVTLVDLALQNGHDQVAMFLLAKGAKASCLSGVRNHEVLARVINAGYQGEFRESMLTPYHVGEKRFTHRENKSESSRQPLHQDLRNLSHVDSRMIPTLSLSPIKANSCAADVSQDTMILTHEPCGDAPPTSSSSEDAQDTLRSRNRIKPSPTALSRASSSIQFSSCQDAARVLVMILDSHIGDVLDLQEDKHFDPNLILSRRFDHSDKFYLLIDHLNRLHEAGVIGMEKALFHLKGTMARSEQFPGIDLSMPLTAVNTALSKCLSDILDQVSELKVLNEEHSILQAQSEDAAKDLRLYERLSQEKNFLEAVKAEESWMQKTLLLISLRGDLLKRVEGTLHGQRNVLTEVIETHVKTEEELLGLQKNSQEQLRTLERRLQVLMSFRDRVSIVVESLTQTWLSRIPHSKNTECVGENSSYFISSEDEVRSPVTRSKTATGSFFPPGNTWLMDMCCIYHWMRQHSPLLHPDSNFAPMEAPQATLREMMEWFHSHKVGEAACEQKEVHEAVRLVHNQNEMAHRVQQAVLDSLHLTTTHLQAGLHTLTGLQVGLHEVIPNTYDSLHIRLLENQRLCKKNITDIQAELRAVLLSKNKSFEMRRLTDLARFEEQAEQLTGSLDREEHRLSEIEEIVHRAFASISKFVPYSKLEEIRNEFLEHGLHLHLVPLSQINAESARSRASQGAQQSIRGARGQLESESRRRYGRMVVKAGRAGKAVPRNSRNTAPNSYVNALFRFPINFLQRTLSLSWFPFLKPTIELSEGNSLGAKPAGGLTTNSNGKKSTGWKQALVEEGDCNQLRNAVNCVNTDSQGDKTVTLATATKAGNEPSQESVRNSISRPSSGAGKNVFGGYPIVDEIHQAD